jgi:hypothetical protein
MATLQQVRDKANTKLATFWSALQTREDACFAQTGRYFQLLWTSLPLDGADTQATFQFRTDLDYVNQINTSWSDTLPFMLEVHEWDAGYMAICTINHEGTLYQRSRTNTNVDSGWFILEAPHDPRYGSH